jgi:hypothetical protein
MCAHMWLHGVRVCNDCFASALLVCPELCHDINMHTLRTSRVQQPLTLTITLHFWKDRSTCDHSLWCAWEGCFYCKSNSMIVK